MMLPTKTHLKTPNSLPMAHSLAAIEPLKHALRLVEAFHAFDSDNDGSITAQELNGIMVSLGYNPSEKDISDMMEKGDTSGDGLLSISEFLDLNIENMGVAGDLASALKGAFEGMQLQEDDFVTGEELCEVIQNLGIELPLNDYQDLAASIDGEISFQDLEMIMNVLV